MNSEIPEGFTVIGSIKPPDAYPLVLIMTGKDIERVDSWLELCKDGTEISIHPNFFDEFVKIYNDVICKGISCRKAGTTHEYTCC